MSDILNLPGIFPVLPELVLVLGAMALLMIGVFSGDRATGGISAVAIALLAACIVILVMQPSGKVVAFHGSFVLDGYARFLKILALTGSAVAILMSIEFLSATGRQKFEYPVLILLSTADLIALYLGFELMSLALYVIAAIDRDNVRSTEAGLKYFVLGAL